MSLSPAQWLLKAAKKTPVSKKPWRQSVRMALVTAIPLIIGFLTGHLAPAIIICLGGFLTSMSSGNDPYHARFHRLLILAPFGMLGYLLGGLLAGHGLWTIVGVTAVTLAAGIISSYGAVFALSGMQLLVMTVVAAHAPSSGSIWLMPVCFLIGGLYSALLLEIEALFFPSRPQRTLLAHLLDALSQEIKLILTGTADEDALQKARHAVNDAQDAAYQATIHDQTHMDGRTRSGNQVAQILAITDRIASLLISERHNPEELKNAAQWLDKMRAAILFKEEMKSAVPAEQNSGILTYNIQSLSQIIIQYGTSKFSVHSPVSSAGIKMNAGNLSYWKQKLIVGPQAIHNTLRLTLCMLIALIAEQVVPGDRSYWLPLTVAVVMKADAGSVYVRAVHRCLGTIIGVIFAALLFAIMPKDIWLSLVVGIFAALIPWASLRSYAWLCAVMTPIVLIIMDLLVPGPTVDYGFQRMADTLMGSFIVLVFGYLIWPKTAVPSVREGFLQVISTLSSYLDSLAQLQTENNEGRSPALDNSADIRRKVYTELSDLHTRVKQALSEPSPVSSEAKAWLPIISAAEKISDDITNFAAAADEDGTVPCRDKIKETAELLQKIASQQADLKNPGEYDAAMLEKGGAVKALFEIHEDVLKLYALTSKGFNIRKQPQKQFA